MSREWRLYLDDMIECCRKIQSYTQNLDFAEFTTRGMVHDAVVRNLEVLGEAAKNIPCVVVSCSRSSAPALASRAGCSCRR